MANYLVNILQNEEIYLLSPWLSINSFLHKLRKGRKFAIFPNINLERLKKWRVKS